MMPPHKPCEQDQDMDTTTSSHHSIEDTEMMEEDETETLLHQSFRINTSYVVPKELQVRYISSNKSSKLLLKRNENVKLSKFFIHLLQMNFRRGIYHQRNKIKYCVSEMKL